MTNTNSWTITLIQDNDDAILPLPNDLLDLFGWQEGDTIEWIDNGDGSWILKKALNHDPETKA